MFDSREKIGILRGTYCKEKSLEGGGKSGQESNRTNRYDRDVISSSLLREKKENHMALLKCRVNSLSYLSIKYYIFQIGSTRLLLL